MQLLYNIKNAHLADLAVGNRSQFQQVLVPRLRYICSISSYYAF